MTAAIYRLAWLGLVVNLYSPPHILIYPCNASDQCAAMSVHEAHDLVVVVCH